MYSALPEWNDVATALHPYYPDDRGYNDYLLYDDNDAGEGRQTVVQVELSSMRKRNVTNFTHPKIS